MTVGAIHESPDGRGRVRRMRPGESEKPIVYCRPFVNGPYGVHVGCLLNKPDTQK